MTLAQVAKVLVNCRLIDHRAVHANSARRATMRNIEMKLEGDSLLIQIDLSKEYGTSRSGRTIIVASTEGSVPIPFPDVPDGLSLNATLYKSIQR